GPEVEPPGGIANGGSVEMIDLSVLVLFLNRFHLGGNVGNRAVDLAGPEAVVDWSDDFADRLAGFAEELQALHERDHPGICKPVVAKVEMPGMLAAEGNVLVAHDLLDEGMSDRGTDRDPARFCDRLRYAAAADQVVEDLRAGELFERVDADERRHHVAADELGFFGDDEHPVRVAVEGSSQVATVLAD